MPRGQGDSALYTHADDDDDDDANDNVDDGGGGDLDFYNDYD